MNLACSGLASALSSNYTCKIRIVLLINYTVKRRGGDISTVNKISITSKSKFITDRKHIQKYGPMRF
jgi:hypothetical protein